MGTRLAATSVAIVTTLSASLPMGMPAALAALPRPTQAQIRPPAPPPAPTPAPAITDAALSRVPIRVAPRIDALPVPVTRESVDLGTVVREFQSLPGAGIAAGLDGPRLLIFISLGMPQPTLSRLVDQAARARAVLVLRGLDQGSLQATVVRARALIGSRSVDLRIDPEAFDRHGITRVPSFVLSTQSATSADCGRPTCAAGTDPVQAAGDVSLEHVLEVFQRSSPRHATAAAVYLRRLAPPAR